MNIRNKWQFLCNLQNNTFYFVKHISRSNFLSTVDGKSAKSIIASNLHTRKHYDAQSCTYSFRLSLGFCDTSGFLGDKTAERNACRGMFHDGLVTWLKTQSILNLTTEGKKLNAE